MSTDDEVLDGLLSDEPPPLCLDRLPYARRVGELIRMPGAFERWQQRCHESFLESRLRHRQLENWQNARQQPCYALDRLADDGCPHVEVPELGDGQRPYAGGPLPFSSRHGLSLADTYFVLALIHDADRRDAGRINPFGPDAGYELTILSAEEQEWRFWYVQALHVSTLRASDQVTLDGCLARVEADSPVDLLGSSPSVSPLVAPIASESAARDQTSIARKPKRSVKKGEARVKIIAGLTKHHQYADGGCLNQEPITVREFAKEIGVAPDSVSQFFKKEFGEERGYAGYRAACRNVANLGQWLKLHNADYSTHPLFGRTPPGEGSKTDTEE